MKFNTPYQERDLSDIKAWSPHANKTYWQRNPKDSKEVRTCYFRFNVFNGKTIPMFSNYVVQEPPEGMKELNPMLLSSIMRMNNYQDAPFH